MLQRRLVFALCILAITAAPLGAQRISAADSAEAARLFSARQWADAAKLFDRMVRADSTRVREWMQLGFSLDSLGRRSEALRAYEGARRSGGPLAPAMFQLARTHAALGADDRALAYLDSAAANGFGRFEVLRDDVGFARLRGRDPYRRTLARIESNRFPCRTNAEAR